MEFCVMDATRLDVLPDGVFDLIIDKVEAPPCMRAVRTCRHTESARWPCTPPSLQALIDALVCNQSSFQLVREFTCCCIVRSPVDPMFMGVRSLRKYRCGCAVCVCACACALTLHIAGVRMCVGEGGCPPRNSPHAQVAQYLREMHRVLAPGGVFICISHGVPVRGLCCFERGKSSGGVFCSCVARLNECSSPAANMRHAVAGVANGVLEAQGAHVDSPHLEDW